LPYRSAFLFFQKFEGSAENGEWTTVEPVLKDLEEAAKEEKPKKTRKTAAKVSP